jgi:TonB family protein
MRALKLPVIPAIVCCFVSNSALASPSALAEVPRTTREQMWISSPDPEYPPDALKKHIWGRGLYHLRIDPRKRTVTRVTVLESTGSKVLDDAAIRALLQWRLRPGDIADRVAQVKVPVSFIPR